MNRFILATGLATALVVAVTGGSFGRETAKAQSAAPVAAVTSTQPAAVAGPAVGPAGCR